jgi:hypothetical protein
MRRPRRGSTLLEFTLVGIPLIFVMISTFEMSRGMWLYHSLAHAAKTGARYAVVHGKGCSDPGNTCAASVSNVAHRIAAAAVGLRADALDVTLESEAGPVHCAPLSGCFGNSDSWPPENANVPGMRVRVSARHEFHSALAMFWPGAGSVHFGAVTFAADSLQAIQF